MSCVLGPLYLSILPFQMWIIVASLSCRNHPGMFGLEHAKLFILHNRMDAILQDTLCDLFRAGWGDRLYISICVVLFDSSFSNVRFPFFYMDLNFIDSAAPLYTAFSVFTNCRFLRFFIFMYESPRGLLGLENNNRTFENKIDTQKQNT